MTDRVTSPGRVYAVRSAFSGILAILYLVSAIVLGMSRLITGPPAEDSYRSMYITCLTLVVVSFVLSAQQMLCAGLASWYLMGSRKWYWT